MNRTEGILSGVDEIIDGIRKRRAITVDEATALFMSFSTLLRAAYGPVPAKRGTRVNKKKRRIPAGYERVTDFYRKRFGSRSSVPVYLRCDPDLSPFRQKIGAIFYVDHQKAYEFFDSEVGRKRYARLVPSLEAYKKKLALKSLKQNGNAQPQSVDSKEPQQSFL